MQRYLSNRQIVTKTVHRYSYGQVGLTWGMPWDDRPNKTRIWIQKRIRASNKILVPSEGVHNLLSLSDSVGVTDAYADFDPLTKSDAVGVTDGRSYTPTIFPQPGTEFIAPQRIVSFDAPIRPEIPAVQRDMDFDAPVRVLEFYAPRGEDE